MNKNEADDASELTVHQAADYLGVSETRMETLLRSGEIVSNFRGDLRTVLTNSLVDYDRETSKLQGVGFGLLNKQAQELGWYD